MLAAGITRSQPNRNVEFVAEAFVSGDYQDVKIVGENIFCANTYGVVVYTFDEENPEEPPVEIARFPTPGQANALFLDDTLCYVADGSRGLQIYDISDLNRVLKLGSWEEEGGFIAITVWRGVAYLNRDRIGIYSIDISDPTDPSLLGFLQFSARDIKRLTVHNEFLWTIQSPDGYYLTAIDISNPREFRIEGQYEGAGAGGDFSLNEDFAFCARDSLVVLDISQPREIQCIGSYINRMYGYGVIYQNGYLFTDYGACVVTDVRNLNDIRTIGYSGAMDLIGSNMIDFNGNYVFSPTTLRGLKIVNVADKTDPCIQHVNLTNGVIRDVVYQNGYIYAADSHTGIWPEIREDRYYLAGRWRIYSVENPHHPIQVFEMDSLPSLFDRGFRDIEIIRDSLVCLGGSVSLNIFNINDVQNPEQILGGGPDDNRTGTGRSPTYQGDFMFTAGDNTIFRVKSLADPAQPQRLVNFVSDETNDHYKVFPNGDLLFTTGRAFRQFYAVITYDWSDYDNIERVGEWEQLSGGLKADGVRRGDYLYLVGGLGGSGMSVVNIEDPLNPEEVYYTNEVRSGIRAVVSRNHLFIAEGYNGVRIFDLDDPEHPQPVGYYDTPGYCQGVAVDEERGYLFTADQSDLSVYDVGSLLGVWDLSVSPEVFDFGGVEMGDTLIDTVYVTNRASKTVMIDSIRISEAFFTIGVYDSAQLQPDEELTVEILFTPDTIGAFESRLDVYSLRRELTVELMGIGEPLGVTETPEAPLEFRFDAPYPNPFNSSINITYTLPTESHIDLNLFDVSGRLVEELDTGTKQPGRHNLQISAGDRPAGLYFVRLRTAEASRIQKIMLLR